MKGATTGSSRACWLFCQEQLKLANFKLLLLIMKCLQTHQDLGTCTHYSELFDERFVQTCLTARGSSTNHLVWPSFKSSTFTDCQGTCQPHRFFQPWFLQAEKGETFPGRRIRRDNKTTGHFAFPWDKVRPQTVKAGFKFRNIFIPSWLKDQERHMPDQWTVWKTLPLIFSSWSQKVIALAYLRVIFCTQISLSPCISHLLITLALGVWLQLLNGLQCSAVPFVTQLPQMHPLSSSLFSCFNFVLFLLEPEKEERGKNHLWQTPVILLDKRCSYTIVMGERNLEKIKSDWQHQCWISRLGYWCYSARGPISNTIIFHIPAKHTDLNVFISHFLSPPIMVHHSHCCIINNPSSVCMCIFVAQMEKSSTWSTAIAVEGTIWRYGKNSQVCPAMSVWGTVHG